MRLQHGLKLLLKPLLFDDRITVRKIRRGSARGASMWLNRMESLQIEFGVWESELTAIYRRHIVAGEIVYDIGSADGLNALMYASLGGRVYAYEPDPSALDLFDKNLLLNPSLARRITIIRDVYTPLTSVPPPSFVKIDVDGAESDVLRMLPAASAVVVETHSAELELECEVLLREAGYVTRVIRNAWWRRFYPEYRPIEHNRWLLATRRTKER